MREPAPRTSTAAGAQVALVHDWLTGMRGGERVLERQGLATERNLVLVVRVRTVDRVAEHRHEPRVRNHRSGPLGAKPEIRTKPPGLTARWSASA